MPDNYIADLIKLFLLSLAITFIIHPLPMLIYRYAISKEPIAPKKARPIVIVDAIVVFVIWIIIKAALHSGGAVSFAPIVLWSFVSYRILTKGYTESEQRAPSKSEELYIKEAAARGIDREEAKKIYNSVFREDEIVESSLSYIPPKEEFIELELSRGRHRNTAEGLYARKYGAFISDTIPNSVDNAAPASGQISDSYAKTQEDGQSAQEFAAQSGTNDSASLQSQRPKIMFCRKCGSRLGDNVKFCHNCGCKIIIDDN